MPRIIDQFDGTEEELEGMREVVYAQLLYLLDDHDSQGSLEPLKVYRKAQKRLRWWVPVYEALEDGRIVLADFTIEALAELIRGIELSADGERVRVKRLNRLWHRMVTDRSVHMQAAARRHAARAAKG